MSTFKIKSEIYSELDLESLKTDNGNVVSRFYYNHPKNENIIENNIDIKVDKDGDLIVPRRKTNMIEIEHSPSTVLKLVGLQVWRGALLLADFIIWKSKEEFENKTILEIGSGVGLTSIVAGFYAKKIICTDIDLGGILNLIKNNLERNKNLIKSNSIEIMELDFTAKNWSNELNNALNDVDIVLAADVIYDDDLTESFINTIEKLLTTNTDHNCKKKIIYVSLEKRYVFTIADLDTGAPCFDYFLKCFNQLKLKLFNKNLKLNFISTNFPQYFQYERIKELTLFQITCD